MGIMYAIGNYVWMHEISARRWMILVFLFLIFCVWVAYMHWGKVKEETYVTKNPLQQILDFIKGFTNQENRTYI